MKHFFLLACLFSFCTLRAVAEDHRPESLRAADDERVAAILSPDKERLSKIFSDDLRYAHSNGAVDTKSSYIDVLTTGKTKYHKIDYEERNFTFPAPHIALMNGRAHVQVTSAAGEVDMVMSFLAVWREEDGHWRFLAWQSCKLPPKTPDTK